MQWYNGIIKAENASVYTRRVKGYLKMFFFFVNTHLCRSETQEKDWHITMLEGRMRRVEGVILKFMALFESICIRKRLRRAGKGVLALSVFLVLHAACSLHWDWRDKRITGFWSSWKEEACGVQVILAAFPLISFRQCLVPRRSPIANWLLAYS